MPKKQTIAAHLNKKCDAVLKQQLQRPRCLCEGRMPPENSVIFYLLLLFLLLFLFVWLIVFFEMKSSIYIFACVSAFSEGVVQFYKHTQNQLMP